MGYTHILRTPSSVSDTATTAGILYHKPGGFVKDEIGAALPRKEENRLQAVFRIDVPARDGRLRGPVAVLLGISTTKGVPPWILLCTGDSRLSARTDSGFHAAERSEVTKLGAGSVQGARSV